MKKIDKRLENLVKEIYIDLSGGTFDEDRDTVDSIDELYARVAEEGH